MLPELLYDFRYISKAMNSWCCIDRWAFCCIYGKYLYDEKGLKVQVIFMSFNSKENSNFSKQMTNYEAIDNNHNEIR